MIEKRLLCPERLRRVPAGFSWVDHRLVRDGYIRRCGTDALALYLLLVCVGDEQGLSYYSDATAAGLINLAPTSLARVRQQLIGAELIAYHKPLYQVLSLEPPRVGDPPPAAREDRGAAVLGEVLQQMMKGGQR